MSDDKKKKQKLAQNTANVLETLREKGISGGGAVGKGVKNIASETGNQIKDELLKETPREFMRQVLGMPRQNFSGEIEMGESLKMNEVLKGERQEKENMRKRAHLEKRLREEESRRVEQKTNQLRMQLNALMKEVMNVTEKTQGLAEEARIAAMQAPAEPGEYHVTFFENLLSFLKSFSKKVEEASVWLQAANKRASKKNKWGANYKKHGAKYLLSGEHYLTRSAG